MFRNVAFVVVYIALLVLAAASTQAAQYGTAEEAKAMLDRAVAEVKEDKARALDMFNKGEAGFKGRDLMSGAPTPRILTAHPTNKGKELRDIEGQHGDLFSCLV